MKNATSYRDGRRVPLSERLEQRLLFAAVVRSGAAEDHDALWSVLRDFEGDLAGPFGGPFGDLNRRFGEPGNADIRGWRHLEFRERLAPYEPLPLDVPGNHYRDTYATGLALATPGTGFQRSEYFAHVNPTYPFAFEQKSTFAALLSPVGSNITDATFTVPGTSDLVAATKGFGVLFLDVDNPTATTLEFFDAAGASLGKFGAPAFNNGISFLGVTFNAGEQAARVRITTGNMALGPDDEGPARDAVVMNSLTFGEPQPIQPNVYRWDSSANVSAMSAPQGWTRRAAPPPNAGAVLEFPEVPQNYHVGGYDYPSGTSFDSLVFTGNGAVIRGSNVMRLTNGIRSVAPIGGGRLDLPVELLRPQTFTALRPQSKLDLGHALDLNGHDLTLNGAGMITFAGSTIEGPEGGTLIHAGPGPATLGATNVRLPGGVEVRGGELTLNMTNPTDTAVRVTGGTFSSRSRVGPLTATGGIVSPNGRFFAGVLSTTGGATFGPAATFEVNIRPGPVTPGTSHDQLNVTGGVSLGGATLTPIFAQGAAPGNSYVIVVNDAADAVSGTFKGLPEGALITSNGVTARISYRGGSGNDVTLTIVTALALDQAYRGQALRIAFVPGSAPESLWGEGVTLTNLTTGSAVPLSSTGFSYDPATRTGTWSLPGGPLPMGNYQVTFESGLIDDVSSDFTFDFFVLPGDVNQDRVVNGSDFSILAGNFGKTGQTYGSGDVNGDGRVDGSDFALLAGHFGKSLAAEPPPAQASVTPPPAAERTAPERPTQKPRPAAVVRHKAIHSAPRRQVVARRPAAP